MIEAIGQRLELVTDVQRLHEVAHLWRPHAATPFHTPEWLLTWWHHFGSENLHTFLAWDSDTLVGVVPCFRHHWEGARQLTLIGSGITDYLDPWIPTEHVHTVVEHLAESEWDVCNWQDLSPHSPFLDTKLWCGAQVEIHPETPVSAIPLQGCFEEYWRNRSKDLRRNLRRYRDRAEQSGPLEFHTRSDADHKLIEELIYLHGARWQKRGQAGMVEQNQSADFIHDISRRFAFGTGSCAATSSSCLRLFALCWKQKTVAASVGFVWRGRLYSYLSAFLPEHEILGFGRILLYESLKSAWVEGLTAWDFLRGEEAYKSSWGAVAQPRVRLIVRRS